VLSGAKLWNFFCEVQIILYHYSYLVEKTSLASEEGGCASLPVRSLQSRILSLDQSETTKCSIDITVDGPGAGPRTGSSVERMKGSISGLATGQGL
jgi:hypothetical protein